MNTALEFDLEAENASLETSNAHRRIEWAARQFGERLVLSTSFGIQAAVMLGLAQSVVPGIPVVFLDTGYLFPETYTFAEELTQRLKLNLKVYNPLMTSARQEALYGKRWEMGIEGLKAYNFDNKVEPMNRAIVDLNAEGWMTGLRRSQSSTRAEVKVLQKQNRLTKINPIIDWSDRDVYEFLKRTGLPYHPLWDKGYVSVGDVHSTSRLEEGMRPEDTRFGGLKRECGLHETSNRVDFQI